MLTADRRGGVRLLETRLGRYEVAWIPLDHSPLPGFRACAVQAVPVGVRPARAVRLVLYERLEPLPDNGDSVAA